VEWNETEVTTEWPEAHRSPDSVDEWESNLSAAERRRFRDLNRFFSYVQWVARTQWKTVRAACERLGVALMGDIPVGVSLFSADVWAEGGFFDLTRSSGAPPEKVFKSDPFTEQWGQNWGFPLYNWQAMSHDNFAWWRRRLRSACEVFHFLRVDHALGFFRIYAFPWRPSENEKFIGLTASEAAAITGGSLPGFVERDDSTDANREHNRLQGEMLFGIFLEETGPHRLIAEDLGEVAPYVRPTLQALSVPGFKIPQWERLPDGSMIPGADYQRLSLATFATHDHPPVRVWWRTLMDDPSGEGRREIGEVLKFCGHPELGANDGFSPEVHAALVNGLFACNSWLAVHQITDLFALEERFNIPGAVGDKNWTTRIDGVPDEWDQKFGAQITTAVEGLRASGRSTLA
jgi:4-alpha-glucanotransferase